MKSEEYFSLSRELEKHHALFYSVWDLGVPIFTETIPTAAVKFDLEGDCIEFVFNPKYWETLNEYERKFVICHECLHVILNHGFRIQAVDKEGMPRCNIALDVVVNHMLCRRFGFDRSLIRNEANLCWTDTVFPNQSIEDDECFEHYFNLIPEHKETVDDHSGMAGSNWDEIIEKVSGSLSDEEKQSIQDLVEKYYESDGEAAESEAGTGTTGRWEFAKVGIVPKKKKWETVIKKWSKKFDKPDYQEVDQWARTNRRFTMLSEDLMLPTDMEQEFQIEGKIDVWFFQDTSGSCAGYRDRFFTAAMTLNPNRFNIHLHCFDTQVYETSLITKKLYGFGGTSFRPIEIYIQNKIEGGKYPEAVFIITDGYGDIVKPEKEKNWYIFLTTGYKNCFPNGCNFYSLKDFE